MRSKRMATQRKRARNQLNPRMENNRLSVLPGFCCGYPHVVHTVSSQDQIIGERFHHDYVISGLIGSGGPFNCIIRNPFNG